MSILIDIIILDLIAIFVPGKIVIRALSEEGIRLRQLFIVFKCFHEQRTTGEQEKALCYLVDTES